MDLVVTLVEGAKEILRKDYTEAHFDKHVRQLLLVGSAKMSASLAPSALPDMSSIPTRLAPSLQPPRVISTSLRRSAEAPRACGRKTG